MTTALPKKRKRAARGVEALIAHLKGVLTVPLSRFDAVVEPSCSDGALRDLLTSDGVAPLCFDAASTNLAPREDFVKWMPAHAFLHDDDDEGGGGGGATAKSTCLVVGVAPYGPHATRGVACFNHAARFADVIALVVPRTFCKTTIRNRLDRHFFLVAQYDDAAEVGQIWVHGASRSLVRSSSSSLPPLRPLVALRSETSDFTFVSARDGVIAIRRVGENAGRVFTDAVTSRSATSHLFVAPRATASLTNVLRLLAAADLERSATKYATAACPSLSKNELCVLYERAKAELK